MARKPKDSKARSATDLLQNQTKQQKKQKPEQSKWFELILYPQDNEQNRNKDLLDYIEKTPLLFPKYVWILHDKDIDEKGNPKKDHIHLLLNTNRRYTMNGLNKHFDGVLNTMQLNVVHNEVAYILYMLHETFSSVKDGKWKYSVDDMHGNNGLISIVKVQNENFVQKETFYMARQATCYDDLFEKIYEHYEAPLADTMIDYIVNHAFFGKYLDQKISIERNGNPFKPKSMLKTTVSNFIVMTADGRVDHFNQEQFNEFIENYNEEIEKCKQ
jgi:hypothetical protein